MAPMGIFRHCLCFRPKEDDVKSLDYSHYCLDDVPSNVFSHERTLEHLSLDANQIRDLPRALFHCEGLRKLGLSDNELQSLPAAISTLSKLEELNISRNHILSIPESIKECKCLRIIEASVNPLGPRLPDGFTQLINLQELYLNDTFLEYLPANFGRLARLQVVEMRENHLKALPKSMSRLVELRRLDIGNNDFFEFPEVVGTLSKLNEFWCDNNRINSIPSVIGNLKLLNYLDASNNRIEEIADEIGECISLVDLTISSNNLTCLPETIGNLNNLLVIRCDENEIKLLPSSIGNLSSIEEIVFSENEIEIIPSSIGLLRNLHTLIVDSNKIQELPTSIGSCMQLRILSLANNQIKVLPDEIGRLASLKVLNLNSNSLKYLPFSLTKLTQLQAIWLSENQNKPLIPLQSDVDPETGQKVLTCFLLPQLPFDNVNESSPKKISPRDDNSKPIIKFSPDSSKTIDNEEEFTTRLIRAPTPYPKELKAHARHARNLALKQKDANAKLAQSQDDKLTNGNTEMVHPVNEEESVLKDAKTNQIEIKEAKVSKAPKSPLNSRMRSKSEDYEMAERPSSLPLKSCFKENPDDNNKNDVKDASNPELIATRLSQLVNEEVSTPKELSQKISHERKGSYKFAVNKTSVLKSPVEIKLQHKISDEFDRGYRSDHELYANESFTKKETQLGYSSDLDTQKSTNENNSKKSPIQINSKVNQINGNRKEDLPVEHVLLENQENQIQLVKQSKTDAIDDTNHVLIENTKPASLKSDSLFVQSKANDGFSNSSNASLYPSSGSDRAISTSSRPSSFSSTSQHSPLIHANDSQTSLPPKPQMNSFLQNKSPSETVEQPGIPLAPIIATNKSQRYPLTASSQFIIHKFSHDSATSLRNSLTSRKEKDLGTQNENHSVKSWDHESIHFFDNSDESYSSNSSISLLNNHQSQPQHNLWLINSNTNSHVFPVIIVKNPGLGFNIESYNSLNNNLIASNDAKGIYVSNVIDDGPASTALKVGDKILQVDGIDLQNATKEKAFNILQSTGNTISLIVSREKT